MKIFQNYLKVIFCIFIIFSYCSKPTQPPKPNATMATLTTNAISTITKTDAQGGGNVTADGGSAITFRGICWSTAAAPTITGSKTIDGSGAGNFSSSITGLTPNTTYYTRAYATNSIGTAYGNEVSFTTEEEDVMPVLTTNDITTITPTTAKSGGNITVGGTTITARGICWSTTTNPTIADSKSTDGTGAGTFTSFSTSLAAGTTYYVRAYATNSTGTAYGNEISFTTLPVVANKLYDIDGNVYNTVTIGNQIWMLENLKTTHYRNGEFIPNAVTASEWIAGTSGAYAIYENNTANNSLYGQLYNWFAVTNTRNIAPEGWHIPTSAELTSLIEFLGGSGEAGGAMKEAGTAHWISPNTGATNSSGFIGLPGGYRDESGAYGSMGNTGYWWTTTEDYTGSTDANALALFTSNAEASIVTGSKKFGTSVRCVKD